MLNFKNALLLCVSKFKSKLFIQYNTFLKHLNMIHVCDAALSRRANFKSNYY